jgi:hypothetical protein
LVASLSLVSPDHPEVATLLEASRAVPLDSPGGTTLAYHRVRLMIAKGERTETRALLDRLLREDVEARGPSARSLFLDQRLQVATDLADLSAHLPRLLVAWGRRYYGELPEGSRMEGDRGPGTSPVGARLLNGLPLSDLSRLATKGDDSTGGLRFEIAQAAWVKALVLEDEAMLSALEHRYPELAGGSRARSRPLARLIQWTSEIHPPWVVPDGPSQPRERWEPGLSPMGTTGWWCDTRSGFELVNAESPAFLETKAAERAQTEWAAVVAAGSGPEFAARRAARLARETPDEPAIPQALHLAVASTRWACSSGAAGVGEASLQAFRLLQQRYPGSVWAKKTKYWYAGRH